MNRHMFWMVIGCVAPLILVFVLPLIGIKGSWPLLAGLVGMFVLHLFMMGRHRGEGEDHEGHENGGDSKEAHHGHH